MFWKQMELQCYKIHKCKKKTKQMNILQTGAPLAL